jgi:hypothetical protein
MIIELQRRIMEIGRLRLGQQVPVGKSGKTRPAKLETWRFTSANETAIRQAAKLYGGDVQPWQAPAGAQWEVITDATTLPILLPPTDMAFSQNYELWSGGGCQRRCDGVNESLSAGPCLCDPDNRECAIHTRLSVLLANMAGVGVWRVDTQGYYAAVELQGAVDLLQMAAGRGTMLPAQLRLEQRMVKRPNQQTRRFAVPVLDVEISPAQLLSGTTTDALDAGTLAVEPPRNNGTKMTPVPDSVAHHPVGSIAEQIAPPPPPKRRGQTPIPATGIQPRTTTQAAETAEPDLDEPVPISPGQIPLIEEPDNDDEDDGPLITAPQLTKLSILLKENGFDDRQARHDYVIAAIGRPITTAKELTQTEATQVIDSLES